MNRYRVGRKLGRTLYVQLGDEASDADVCLGMLDDPDFAAYVAAVLNQYAREQQFDHARTPADRARLDAARGVRVDSRSVVTFREYDTPGDPGRSAAGGT